MPLMETVAAIVDETVHSKIEGILDYHIQH